MFRFTGKAIWNINKHFKLQGTIGTDINSMNFEDFIAKTTPGTPAGKLTDQIFNNRTLNAEILALYNNSWGDSAGNYSNWNGNDLYNKNT